MNSLTKVTPLQFIKKKKKKKNAQRLTTEVYKMITFIAYLLNIKWGFQGQQNNTLWFRIVNWLNLGYEMT